MKLHKIPIGEAGHREDKKCQKCGKGDAHAWHVCPFQRDAKDDTDTLCDCCKDCVNDCTSNLNKGAI